MMKNVLNLHHFCIYFKNRPKSDLVSFRFILYTLQWPKNYQSERRSFYLNSFRVLAGSAKQYQIEVNITFCNVSHRMFWHPSSHFLVYYQISKWWCWLRSCRQTDAQSYVEERDFVRAGATIDRVQRPWSITRSQSFKINATVRFPRPLGSAKTR